MDKPRGFAVLGQTEAAAFLAPKPVGFIYGVGAVSAAKLAGDGYRLIADLQRADKTELMRRYGEEGTRLWHLARGLDQRTISPDRDTKSVSAETTFNADISEFRPLEQHLWDLTERVSTRLKANALAGTTVTLKLKSADFKIRTRARSLGHPTQLASRIFAAGRDLLKNEVGQTRYRLIGIGVSHLEDATGDDLSDLIDRRAAGAELAVDKLRAKFGKDAVVKGITLEEDER
jgi:DNA polymerase-4